MPEFEEANVAQNQTQHYTPSKDASQKPRTRRRSGGFKTVPANTTPGNIGEVDPIEALKTEKLSGSGKPSAEPETKPEGRGPRTPRAPRTENKERPSSGKAQPSPATLAAIQRVEARIEESRKERDAKRGERSKNRPTEQSTTRSNAPVAPAKSQAPQKKKTGLIASILGFFGIGKTPEAPKTTHHRSSSKGPRQKPEGQRRSNGQGKSQGHGHGQGQRGGKSGGQHQRRRDGQNRRRSSQKES